MASSYKCSLDSCVPKRHRRLCMNLISNLFCCRNKDFLVYKVIIALFSVCPLSNIDAIISSLFSQVLFGIKYTLVIQNCDGLSSVSFLHGDHSSHLANFTQLLSFSQVSNSHHHQTFFFGHA